MAVQISVTNESTAVTDADIQAYLAAQQKQLDRDFSPSWGRQAKLVWCPKGTAPPAKSWQLVFLDNSDQADALGYHLTTNTGMPLAKVFVKTTIADGASWTVCASHEVLEMIADPWDNLLALDQSSNRMYMLEVSDAVEDDQYGYLVDNILVSDFVLPEWFVPGTHRPSGLSFKGHVYYAFQLGKGGYIGYIDLNNLGAGWQQLTARVATRGREGQDAIVEHYPSSPRTTKRLQLVRKEIVEKYRSQVKYGA